MQHETKFGRQLPCITTPLVLVVVMLGTAFGKNEPKTYPIEGKVTATSVNQVPYTYSSSDGKTTSSHRGIARTRTYTVQTDTKTYELDCGKRPRIFSSTPGECGGDKKIQIGDTIHFRIEKGRAYIPITESGQKDLEQKLRILNEDLKSDPE